MTIPASEPIDEQPEVFSADCVDDVYVRGVLLKKGYLLPQHMHAYDHLTVIAHGSVRGWIDGQLLGDYKAPCTITIKANTKHLFLALEEDTVFLCVHNTARTGRVEIAKEHQIA
jgi:quercetin dioxygenase-like cupin family protein